MLDIKLIRECPDEVKSKLIRRGRSYDEDIDNLLAIDHEIRDYKFKNETVQQKRNELNKQIEIRKSNQEDFRDLIENQKLLAKESKQYKSELPNIEGKFDEIMLSLPNIPLDSAPDKDIIVKTVGIPKIGYEKWKEMGYGR